MTLEQVIEIIERYKLRIPPTVYYDLLADVQEAEEEQEPTTKNDLAVDCISRADAIKAMQDKAKKLTNEDTINGLCGAVAILFDMPSVTQEPQTFKWCTGCKEYDQEQHCCHRWSKVIRDTVEEMKQEQEPVLDKIRTEIEQTVSRYSISRERGGMGQIEWSDRLIKENEVLQIIDKYKSENNS